MLRVVVASACACTRPPPHGGEPADDRTGDSSEVRPTEGPPVDPSSPNRGAYVGHDW